MFAKKISALRTLCVILVPSFMGAQTTFNPGVDFSLTDNPNGVWQYGYSETESLAPDQFRFDQYTEIKDTVGFWHPSKGDGNGRYYPYVAFNKSKSHADGAHGWAIRAGEVAMEASNTGQYSLVRFVAPRAGTYRVAVRFEGIHFALSSTDVHVLHDTTSLFAADIQGYGGDSTFHKVEGESPVASYTGTVQLKRGDALTFAVGYGKNKTHACDTTGLIAKVTLVSESP